MELKIYTDGSCAWKTREGGVGVNMEFWSGVITTDVIVRKMYYKGFFDTSIGRMELMALILILKEIKNSDNKITVYSDSQYVVKTFNIWLKQWRRDKTLNQRKNSDLLIQLIEQKERFNNLSVEWCKGHTDTLGNKIADELANIGYRDNKENKIQDIQPIHLHNIKLTQI